MDREAGNLANIGNANAWWIALPNITKIAIYEDLRDIIESERLAC